MFGKKYLRKFRSDFDQNIVNNEAAVYMGQTRSFRMIKNFLECTKTKDEEDQRLMSL